MKDLSLRIELEILAGLDNAEDISRSICHPTRDVSRILYRLAKDGRLRCLGKRARGYGKGPVNVYEVVGRVRELGEAL